MNTTEAKTAWDEYRTKMGALLLEHANIDTTSIIDQARASGVDLAGVGVEEFCRAAFVSHERGTHFTPRADAFDIRDDIIEVMAAGERHEA